MKLMSLLLLICSIYCAQANELSSPRSTFKTYLKAMVDIKNKVGEENKNYEQAISTFRDNLNTPPSFQEGSLYADKLIKVLDKMQKVEYENIPQELKAKKWVFDKRSFKQMSLEISLIKLNDKWYFGPKTVDSLDPYLNLFKDKAYAEGVTPLKNIADKIREKLPTSMQGRLLFLESWQLISLFILIFIAYFIEKVAKYLITFILAHSGRFFTLGSPEKLHDAITPFTKIIFIFVLNQSIPFLDLTTNLNSFIHRALIVAMSVMAIWLGHKIIQYMADYFTKRAEETETRFDDIMIPLLTKTAFVVMYLLGIILVLNSLKINVTGLIAGLGIGGLAFAFAAKDTLANFFGSIMLVLDRPFDIGDIIQSGDIEGIVDEVGFRSTRIRTFNDSLITISNGELMNRSIDNKGKRRFRRLFTTLGLEYDTPAEKIEAFCEGIRQIILAHKYTRKDNFHVYFTNFGASSLDIQLIVYWMTDDYSRELAEKHRLMIDILRLAKELDVGFAFPTQTLHLFNETKVEKSQFESEYLQAGIERAKKVATRPLSLKHPRSNSEDKLQFGDNDIGLD